MKITVTLHREYECLCDREELEEEAGMVLESMDSYDLLELLNEHSYTRTTRVTSFDLKENEN